MAKRSIDDAFKNVTSIIKQHNKTKVFYPADTNENFVVDSPTENTVLQEYITNEIFQLAEQA